MNLVNFLKVKISVLECKVAHNASQGVKRELEMAKSSLKSMFEVYHVECK